MTPLLSVRDLRTSFGTADGPVPVLRGVSFELEAARTLGLVGESGSGKSITALSMIGLLPSAGRVVGGAVELDGKDLLGVDPQELRRLRGRHIAMVFQDSMTSLNPVLTIGRQITESLEEHLGMGHADALRRAAELLAEVGIPEPERRLRQYPHQLSGGLRQRVAVAVALAPDPEVLIADEPTTALDVTIQAQLLELLQEEQRRRGMALVLITHDLGVVARMSDELAVMYAGRIVEHGPTARLFAAPAHPYTEGLLASVPRLDGELSEHLPSISGAPPAMSELDVGCPFRPRCPRAMPRCAAEDPPFEPVGETHCAACWAAVREAVR